MTRLIEKEIILHTGECVALQGKEFDSRSPCSGVLAGCRDEALKFTKPGAFHRRGGRAEPMFDRRQELYLQCCQFAQCWDLVKIGKVSEAILRRQEICPRSEKRQLIQGISTLPGEGVCPPPHLALGVGIESFHAGDHYRSGRCQPLQAQPCLRERGRRGRSQSRRCPG